MLTFLKLGLIKVIKWLQVRSVENKDKFAKRKSMIQNRFKIETGLLIDVVLQGKHNRYI